jgi:hypothetical protein
MDNIYEDVMGDYGPVVVDADVEIPQGMGYDGLINMAYNSPDYTVYQPPQVEKATQQFEQLKTVAPTSSKNVASALVQMKAAESTGDYQNLLNLEKTSRESALDIIRKQQQGTELTPEEQVGLLLATLLPVVAGAAISGKQGALAGIQSGATGGLAAMQTKMAMDKQTRGAAMSEAGALLDEANTARKTILDRQQGDIDFSRRMQLQNDAQAANFEVAQLYANRNQGGVREVSEAEISANMRAIEGLPGAEGMSDEEKLVMARGITSKDAFQALKEQARETAKDDRQDKLISLKMGEANVIGKEYIGASTKPDTKVANDFATSLYGYTKQKQAVSDAISVVSKNGFAVMGSDVQEHEQAMANLVLAYNSGEEGLGKALTGPEEALIKASVGAYKKGTGIVDAARRVMTGYGIDDQVNALKKFQQRAELRMAAKAVSVGWIDSSDLVNLSVNKETTWLNRVITERIKAGDTEPIELADGAVIDPVAKEIKVVGPSGELFTIFKRGK